MAATFLLLHGLDHDRPPQHWLFQLGADLARQGVGVRYPTLPESEAPDLGRWLDVLDRLVAAEPAEQTTVVCHSLGCMLWLHAAARRLFPPVDRVLLVSPPASDQLPDYAAAFRIEIADAAPVRASARRGVEIAASDNDPYNPDGAATMYGAALDLRTHMFPGAGHLTPETGYGRWPWVLDWCTDGPVS